jgi:hypothetical protein
MTRRKVKNAAGIANSYFEDEFWPDSQSEEIVAVRSKYEFFEVPVK